MVTMKKLALLCACCLIQLCASAQNDERLRIAVFDPASSGTSIDEGTKIAIREIICSTIVNTGKYNIVERSLLEKVMQEQQFSNSGAVDDMQATEVGKLAGANKIALSVVTLTDGKNMLSVKIIDVKTASIERQKVKIVTSDKLLDVVEPLTLEMLDLRAQESSSVVAAATPSPEKSNTPSTLSLRVPDGNLFFFGVDFSAVKIFGAKESNDQFEIAFTGINELMVAEQNKFDFGELANRPVANYPVPAHERNTVISWDDIRTSNPAPQKLSIQEMVKSYNLPPKKGKGIVLIAWVLNKPKAEATYEFVIFDIQTKKILFNVETTADAGGAGLRNYWANTVYQVVKNKKLKKQVIPFL